MYRDDAPQLVIFRTRPAIALLAVGVCVSACAQAPLRSTPGAATGTRQAAVSSPRDLAAVRRGQLGDYDEDEWTGQSDKDNDDELTVDGDGDTDGGRGHYDADDRSFTTFGRPAGAGDRRAIVSLVKRYYTIAAAGDGTRACALIYAPLASGYPEELGEFGARYLRGLKTCATILSRMFEPNRSLLATYAARLRVGAVRVSGGIGLAFLTSEEMPTRKMETIREAGRWRMYAALDSELP